MSVRYAIWSHSAFWIIIFNEIIYTCKQDWSYKGVFPWEREQFAKDANVNKMTKSNTCILGSKSSPNMHGGPSTFFAGVVFCSAGISTTTKVLVNVSSNLRSIDNASEPCTCLANFWSLKYECWTLPFFDNMHRSQIIRVPMKTHLEMGEGRVWVMLQLYEYKDLSMWEN